MQFTGLTITRYRGFLNRDTRPCIVHGGDFHLLKTVAGLPPQSFADSISPQMALTAADFDVRGAVAFIDPSAVVYDARQANDFAPYFAAPASPLPFDLAALCIDSSTSAPASPLPFDLTSLCIDSSTSAPASPLPFDLAALSVADTAEVPRETLIAVANAVDAADYVTLERLAADGYDFNACGPGCDELGVSPLNRIVYEHPLRHGYNVDDTVRLIRWLWAHGARASHPDNYFRKCMWDVLCYRLMLSERSEWLKPIYVELLGQLNQASLPPLNKTKP